MINRTDPVICIFFLDLQIWFICPKYLVVRNFLFFRALCSFNIFYL